MADLDSLKSYYNSWETRLGNWLLLGNARHMGWYEEGTLSPFPIGSALRRMEDRMVEVLNLEPGSRVLDAGCGSGLVAIRMAQKGLLVDGIDICEIHLQQARRTIADAGLQRKIHLVNGDFHNLPFHDGCFDGVYTMEPMLQSTNPKAVYAGFMRVLRPGGRLVMHEYVLISLQKLHEITTKLGMNMDQFSSCPQLDRYRVGSWAGFLKEAGFVDIKCQDRSSNIVPLLRLFYILAFIPAIILRLFGLQYRFRNTFISIYFYEARDQYRYVTISARKPEYGELEENSLIAEESQEDLM